MADPEVRDNPEQKRFEILVDGNVAGRVEYERRGGDVIELIHTEIDDAYEGQGLGGKLARGALDLVRSEGEHVIATCEFMDGWIGKHPEYEDLRVSA
jgi:predicted GNAT family acetyltransferase